MRLRCAQNFAFSACGSDHVIRCYTTVRTHNRSFFQSFIKLILDNIYLSLVGTNLGSLHHDEVGGDHVGGGVVGSGAPSSARHRRARPPDYAKSSAEPT